MTQPEMFDNLCFCFWSSAHKLSQRKSFAWQCSYTNPSNSKVSSLTLIAYMTKQNIFTIFFILFFFFSEIIWEKSLLPVIQLIYCLQIQRHKILGKSFTTKKLKNRKLGVNPIHFHLTPFITDFWQEKRRDKIGSWKGINMKEIRFSFLIRLNLGSIWRRFISHSWYVYILTYTYDTYNLYFFWEYWTIYGKN